MPDPRPLHRVKHVYAIIYEAPGGWEHTVLMGDDLARAHLEFEYRRKAEYVVGALRLVRFNRGAQVKQVIMKKPAARQAERA